MFGYASNETESYMPFAIDCAHKLAKRLEEVRRGDSRDRIARENRTTPAAVAKLNPLVKWEKLRPGDTVTVFKFLSPILVVHKQLGYADLSLLNGEFFRR